LIAAFHHAVQSANPFAVDRNVSLQNRCYADFGWGGDIAADVLVEREVVKIIAAAIRSPIAHTPILVLLIFPPV